MQKKKDSTDKWIRKMYEDAGDIADSANRSYAIRRARRLRGDLAAVDAAAGNYYALAESGFIECGGCFELVNIGSLTCGRCGKDIER